MMTKKYMIPDLKELRLKRAWPQEQLAKLADLSVRTVQRLESGGPASFETITAIASAFEMDVSQLTEPKKKKSNDGDETTEKGGFLIRIENGTQLSNLLSSTDAYQFRNDEQDSEDDTRLVAAFTQDIKDWGEVWDELEPGERIVTAREFTDRIRELESRGLWVFGDRAKRWLIDSKGPFHWNVLVVYVLKSDNPEIIKLDLSKATVFAQTSHDGVERSAISNT